MGSFAATCFCGLVIGWCAAGCASSAEQAVEAAAFDCPRGGLARPFGVEKLIRAANQEGISLKRDPSCSSGLATPIESASNILSTNDVDGVSDREGRVTCDVVDYPFASPPFKVSLGDKFPNDPVTYFLVGNVVCSIDSSAPSQVERLAAAMEKLSVAPVEQRSCPRVRPQPVTVDHLIATAKRHGLRLRRDARCIAPGVVAQASTTLPYAPVKEDDQVYRDQGGVTCLVLASPQPAWDSLVTTDLKPGRRFDFQNVSCTIITLGGDGPVTDNELQVGRLEATMSALR